MAETAEAARGRRGESLAAEGLRAEKMTGGEPVVRIEGRGLSVEGFTVTAHRAERLRTKGRVALASAVSAVAAVVLCVLAVGYSGSGAEGRSANQLTGQRLRADELFSTGLSPWGGVPQVISPKYAAEAAEGLATAAQPVKAQPPHYSHSVMNWEPTEDPVQFGKMDSVENFARKQRLEAKAKALEPQIQKPQPPAPAVVSGLRAESGTLTPPKQVEDVAPGGHIVAIPFDGHFSKSQQHSLPKRTTENGLALGYFALRNLPAETAVRFAKREVEMSGNYLKGSKPQKTSVDSAAEAAIEASSQVVIHRRQKAGIIPRPLNRDWKAKNEQMKKEFGKSFAEDKGSSAEGVSAGGSNEALRAKVASLEREVSEVKSLVGTLKPSSAVLSGVGAKGLVGDGLKPLPPLQALRKLKG